MNVSLSVFGMPLEHYAPVARECEAAGMEAIWLADHLAAPPQWSTAYPYSIDGRPGFDSATPIADVWVVAGHLAAVTERLMVGTGVYVLPLRPAIMTARSAASAQHLLNGRLLFGVGTGWLEEEFAASGTPFQHRGKVLDEILDLLPALWSGQPTAADGPLVQFPAMVVAPAVETPIPLVIGGTAPAALRRAARTGDGWYGPPCDLATIKAVRADIERLREANARSGPFTYFVRLADPFDGRLVNSYREAGFDHVVVSIAGSGSSPDAPLGEKLEGIRRTMDAIAELTG